ncbi:MAG: twin transmembrane helix small protein [Thiobacillaceae bacterium]
MKLIALLFIFFILVSLGSALYYLLKDQGKSDRVVKALTVRVALSMVLFLSLMASYYFGWIPQTGLR